MKTGFCDCDHSDATHSWTGRCGFPGCPCQSYGETEKSWSPGLRRARLGGSATLLKILGVVSALCGLAVMASTLVLNPEARDPGIDVLGTAAVLGGALVYGLGRWVG